MRVRFSVTFLAEMELPDDWDEQAIKFYLEENHCAINHIDREAARIAKSPGICDVCASAEVKVLQIGAEPLREDEESL